MRKLSYFLFFFMSFSAVAELQISDAVVRLLPPGLPNTSAYMTVTNTGSEDINLVSGKSDVVASIELHDHVMNGEMMRMVKQDKVVVPAGETVHFKPGGLHLMMFGLKQSLSEGQKVNLAVITDSGESIEVTATVVLPGQESAHSHHHH